jgi:RsiW-degrading membrane proteinase PrsW (M82 family)
MISAIALIVAAIIPLGFLYFISRLDFYHQKENIRFIAMSGIWGILAYFLAARINPALVNAGIFSRDTLVRFVAPVIEEILKGLILLYLIRQPAFRYFLDGAIYGFAAGIGFAIFENFEYVLGHSSVAVTLAISRVLSTNLIHATGSALIGIALGLARFDRSRLYRIPYLLGGLTLAIAIHSGFNNMVNDGVALLFAFAAGLTGAGIIYLAARRGLMDEKSWVHEKIGVTEGVTSGEAAVVQQLENAGDILAPLAERFGAGKAAQCEKFLFMQAQLAIEVKRIEKMQDEKMRLETGTKMNELRAKMDEVRKEVGAYCMLYLRSIFPDDDPTMMTLMQNRIAAAASANKGEAGTGLWMKLDDRLKPKPVAEEKG